MLFRSTSMGIFGYLSKAHLEHSAELTPLISKVELLNDKIRITKDSINENLKIINQFDEQVNQTMVRSSDEKGINNSVTIRRNQQKERSRIQAENETYQKRLGDYMEEKLSLDNQVAKAESDFGPIKYVAELVYGSGDKTLIDKAVRLVIMLIMIVFDPLAVLLLIAANMSMREEYRRKLEEYNDENSSPIYVADVTMPDPIDHGGYDIPDPMDYGINREDAQPDPTIKVPTANIANIESPAVTTTTYDYTVPFAFEKAKDIASGKF